MSCCPGERLQSTGLWRRQQKLQKIPEDPLRVWKDRRPLHLNLRPNRLTPTSTDTVTLTMVGQGLQVGGHRCVWVWIHANHANMLACYLHWEELNVSLQLLRKLWPSPLQKLRPQPPGILPLQPSTNQSAAFSWSCSPKSRDVLIRDPW